MHPSFFRAGALLLAVSLLASCADPDDPRDYPSAHSGRNDGILIGSGIAGGVPGVLIAAAGLAIFDRNDTAGSGSDAGGTQYLQQPAGGAATTKQDRRAKPGSGWQNSGNCGASSGQSFSGLSLRRGFFQIEEPHGSGGTRYRERHVLPDQELARRGPPLLKSSTLRCSRRAGSSPRLTGLPAIDSSNAART